MISHLTRNTGDQSSSPNIRHVSLNKSDSVINSWASRRLPGNDLVVSTLVSLEVTLRFLLLNRDLTSGTISVIVDSH